MNSRHALIVGVASLVGATLVAPSARSGEDFDALGKRYEAEIRPIVKQFCLKCHSTDVQEGELDLERYGSFDAVRKAPNGWLKVVEMLDNGEMPPDGSRKPSADQRVALREWVKLYLDAEARANAGDPGLVELRRLSNVELDNTVRDLTGVDLRPAREFPADGAAGEGFTNVGNAQAMSPALLDKYVSAAKGIAAHAVLVPDGFRFSEKTTRRDWTDEIVNQIKALYRVHTDPGSGSTVNLQGIVYNTNTGGRIPLEQYLTATIEYRDQAEKVGSDQEFEGFAKARHLSPKYFRLLWETLQKDEPGTLLQLVRDRWKKSSKNEVVALSNEIRSWQGALTRFQGVAHFKPWMEPISPLAETRDFRIKLNPKPGQEEIVLNLVAREAGDGSTGDLVEWKAPRIESPGRPPLMLRDLRAGLRGLAARRKTLDQAAKYLAVVDQSRKPGPFDAEATAKALDLDPRMIAAWIDYLGASASKRPTIEKPFTEKMESGGGHDFVKGWGTPETPSIVANSSDQDVRIPGTVKAHGIAVHPAPDRNVAIGWQSPINGSVKIAPHVLHAHPGCGNGIRWSLEVRRGGERARLASGDLGVAQLAKIEPIARLGVHEGDLISLLVGPRDGNHSCDLTEVDLLIAENEGSARTWRLSADVAANLLEANPHADSLGNREVWHFYSEKVAPELEAGWTGIPRGSLLDLWRDATTPEEKTRLAARVEELLKNGPGEAGETPDRVLHRQLTSATGPLLGRIDFEKLAAESHAERAEKSDPSERFGLSRDEFEKHPLGHPADGASLVVEAPKVIEVRLPAALVAGREFVVNAGLEAKSGAEGSIQAEVVENRGFPPTGLVPGVPILARQGSQTRARLEASIGDFRRIFPAALCYAQIVPVDEVVTLVLFHREDEGLSRLMLDDAEHARLDRLWDELRFVSQDALTVKGVYVQFMEFVTQDGDVRVFEPLRKPIAERAENLRKLLVESEPKQLDSLVKFAALAYRRPLTDAEHVGLRGLYANLRRQNLDHDTAFRLTLARVFMAPSFLYHAEQPPDSPESRPISDWELASRLSYFLHSTTPDATLRALAAEGKLGDPEVLADQTRRLLRDDKIRALATEFACQWLDIRGFDKHDEKSEKVFPEFAALRSAMYEESVRFFIDLFQRNGSLLEVLDTDHTFVNEELARFYGIPDVKGSEWRRVDGIKAKGRGGVLGMASLLAKQSGASRTSPILRGNWLSEMLLGERLPRPPKNVPQLPESELDTNGLTLRQITEKHRSVQTCAKCHDRIDPFGFALESFDAIGRRRSIDLGGRAIDTKVKLKDGTEFADIDGLRDYLVKRRRDEFTRHFCRKLLGFSLGRSVGLSDETLLAELNRTLVENDFRIEPTILKVIQSPQFRRRRGMGSPLAQIQTNP